MSISLNGSANENICERELRERPVIHQSRLLQYFFSNLKEHRGFIVSKVCFKLKVILQVLTLIMVLCFIYSSPFPTPLYFCKMGIEKIVNSLGVTVH